MKHELKTLEKYFQSTWAGSKTFEIRKNDRNFNVDDEIALLEWDPSICEGGVHTGREIEGFITYISNFEQKEGYIVFSFRETYRRE